MCVDARFPWKSCLKCEPTVTRVLQAECYWIWGAVCCGEGAEVPRTRCKEKHLPQRWLKAPGDQPHRASTWGHHCPPQWARRDPRASQVTQLGPSWPWDPCICTWWWLWWHFVTSEFLGSLGLVTWSEHTQICSLRGCHASLSARPAPLVGGRMTLELVRQWCPWRPVAQPGCSASLQGPGCGQALARVKR